ncbi:hypothetical protein GCM10009555_070970 [Acrocarpospora macrocephala]|uniref:Uncharacterized protein n=1 Tax=Acrocarpospora macrocephala TaxID=150177 RepID=A0A5M3WJF0_9ACTN|nr:hypothetical protein [Acrocarpospora macrocephala]GES08756.1 hypothetical protein Amac_023520 [Acrocarpospora macrocephala]
MLEGTLISNDRCPPVAVRVKVKNEQHDVSRKATRAARAANDGTESKGGPARVH